MTPALLLGLAGRRWSGKSTVASVLQHHGFHVIAWADPLKRLAHLIFETPVSVLWGDPEQRDTVRVPFSPDDVTLYCGNTTSLSGAEVIAGLLGDTQLIPGQVRLLHQFRRWQDERFHRGGTEPTVRQVLQWLGTEWGRSFHPDLWITDTLRTATLLRSGGYTYEAVTGLSPREAPMFPLGLGEAPVVISDSRFPNEAQAVRTYGGATWWMDASRRRPVDPADALSQHASEPLRENLAPWIDLDLDRNGPEFGGPAPDDEAPILQALRSSFPHAFREGVPR